MFYTGIVESREDPLYLGRCQVRIVGLHTHDKVLLPTKELPWAHLMQPSSSSSMNGIGATPVGPVEGSTVIIIFTDKDQQMPIMLGTVGGIPQSKLAELIDEDSASSIVITNGGILTTTDGQPIVDSDGTPVQIGTAESGIPNAPANSTVPKPNITEQKPANTPPQDVLKQDIPTKPPPKSTPNPTTAEANIKLLLEACDKVGLKSKYAKCAILGICGGETGWLVKAEDYYYGNADYLHKVFRRTFPTPESAQPYTKWQGTREEFFKKIYSPQGNGSLVGHKDADDGAKYYGRGFNQITGKALYTKIQNFLLTKNITVDFVNKPQSLLDDPSVAALATAAFYSLHVKHDQNDPGYFQKALVRTGADANGTGYAKKQKYYEYFLGSSVVPESTNKPMADEQKTYTQEDVKDLPPAKQAALLEDRSAADKEGFRDPNKKYPLRELMDEPDTNRLARGIIKETAVEFKDSTRSKQIQIANTDETWEQPIAPFGGKYPYSKVHETESGHIFTLDDTPTHENISLYHRKGTFLDIDANGTQVNKIIGDGYTIVDRNGSIFIGGRCVLTVGNGVSILVQGNADIEVEGASVINLKNNADISVANDLNLSVGGDMKTRVAGDYTLEAANLKYKTTGDLNCLIEGRSLITSNLSMQLKTDGNMRFDYARGDFGDIAEAAVVESTELSFIGSGDARTNQFGYLQSPVRPSPPVEIEYKLEEENEAVTNDYVANPTKYYNPQGEENGVKPNVPPPPKDSGKGQSLKSDAASTDIQVFLQKQLELTAQNGYWKETGMGGKPSNQNILRVWSDLGFPNSGAWKSDQTAWCMGFVAWTLKQCGYRYFQTAGARAIRDSTSKFGATKVDIKDAQPGDIVLWDFSHVNFVYTAKNGNLTFVGGNQGGKAKDNNPNSGDVTQSWPGGWSPGRGGIAGIWRPSKT
jgi:predicted chitinase